MTIPMQERQELWKLLPIGEDEGFVCSRLRGCLSRSGHSLNRRRYLCIEVSEQLAFMALDDTLNDICLYEVFVLVEYRHLGVGNWMIQKAKRLARQAGNDRLLVRPGKLDKDYPVEELTNWYSSLGFVACEDDPDLFQLHL